MTKEKCLEDWIKYGIMDKYFTHKEDDWTYFTNGVMMLRDKNLPEVKPSEKDCGFKKFFDEIKKEDMITIDIDKKWFNEWFKGKRRTDKKPMVICLDMRLDNENWYLVFNPYLLKNQFEYCKSYQIKVARHGFTGWYENGKPAYLKPICTFTDTVEALTLPINATRSNSKPNVDLVIEVNV